MRTFAEDLERERRRRRRPRGTGAVIVNVVRQPAPEVRFIPVPFCPGGGGGMRA